MASSTGALRERLDRMLVSLGFASSREIAARTILAGGVFVDGAVVDKPAKLVSPDARIEIEKPAPFVSRSGEKLAAALDHFRICPQGLVCLDVGCSTGGFTDCLLQRGASKVYGVDVGYGQFDWKLRHDERVVLLERTNIRYLDQGLIHHMIDLAVIDVSFISLNLVLPSVAKFLAPGAHVIALVKPQFEVGKGEVGAGGIVRSDVQREAVTKKVIGVGANLGLGFRGRLDSPVKGRKGNREILVAFSSCNKMSAQSDIEAYT
jgi:23S rRNA (cytidine1920-2'-O)/16S rRNA (cytidine1409-2'-O)-methyltransferase